jgi:hypothetical protein
MRSTMGYPHWLMVAGAALVVLGFVGFVFRQNGKVEPDHDPMNKGAKRVGPIERGPP